MTYDYIEEAEFHDIDGDMGYSVCPFCGHREYIYRSATPTMALVECEACGEEYVVRVPATVAM